MKACINKRIQYARNLFMSAFLEFLAEKIIV
jgi:hypothetical protein